MLRKMLFSIFIVIFTIHNDADSCEVKTDDLPKKPVFLNDLQNLTDDNIYGCHILPLAHSSEIDQKQHQLPNKIVPINIHTRDLPMPPTLEPLGLAKFYHYFDTLPHIDVHGYLTLPNDFTVNKQYLTAVLLPSSAGMTSQEFMDAKILNDKGIIVLVINHAANNIFGVDKNFINPMEYDWLKAGLFAYHSIGVLETAPFIKMPAALIGISIGGTAALETLTDRFRTLATADLIHKKPFNLMFVSGALPVRRYINSLSQDIFVNAYHGSDDKYCPVEVITNYARWNTHGAADINDAVDAKIRLHVIEGAGHLYHYVRNLSSYLYGYPHVKDVIKNGEMSEVIIKPSARFTVNNIVHNGFKNNIAKSIIYINSPQVGFIAHFLNDFDRYKIPARILELIESQNPDIGQLTHIMKNDDQFSQAFAGDAPTRVYTLKELFEKILQSYKADVLALGTYQPDKPAITLYDLAKKIPLQNLEIQPHPIAGIWMWQHIQSTIQKYGGRPWTTEQVAKINAYTNRVDENNITLVSVNELIDLELKSLVTDSPSLPATLKPGSYFPSTTNPDVNPRLMGHMSPGQLRQNDRQSDSLEINSKTDEFELKITDFVKKMKIDDV